MLGRSTANFEISSIILKYEIKSGFVTFYKTKTQFSFYKHTIKSYAILLTRDENEIDTEKTWKHTSSHLIHSKSCTLYN